MRILIANEALKGAGGVERYLEALVPALIGRGHVVGIVHGNPASEPGPVTIAAESVWRAGVRDEGLARVLERVRIFAPDICFSHSMSALEVDEALAGSWPVVKMMHGHFGTCVSGQKAFAFPRVVDCGRDFGPGCLAHYLPRRCGPRRPLKMVEQYGWGLRQRALFPRYRHVIVASGFMRDEYLRAGIRADRLHVLPLFAAGSQLPAPISGRGVDVVFLGRMTKIKGGDVLLRAVSVAGKRLRRPLTVVMAGDGPERGGWQRLAASLGLDARFPGWVSTDTRSALLADAMVSAVPSLWTEPFGLVGLEAGACGTPSIGFDVGGISEWLTDGLNGRLIDPAAGANGFGAALADVLGEPETHRRLSAGALAVAARFTVDAHVAGLEGVLGAVADTAARS